MAIAPDTIPLPRNKWVSLNAAAITGRVSWQNPGDADAGAIWVQPSATAALPTSRAGAFVYFPGQGVMSMLIAEVWRGSGAQYLHAYSEAGGAIAFSAE